MNNDARSNQKRVRGFCLSTYLNKEQVLSVLNKHDNQIRAYAFIEHDKDYGSDGQPKERHIHILLQLYNASFVDRVRSWFKGFTDENGFPINTLGQVMHDVSSSFDYLTHNTEQAKLENKFLYDSSEVICNNLSFFKDPTVRDEDNISLALREMLDGIPLQDIAKRYGRDFIIHFHSIKEMFNAIQRQSGGTEL